MKGNLKAPFSEHTPLLAKYILLYNCAMVNEDCIYLHGKDFTMVATLLSKVQDSITFIALQLLVKLLIPVSTTYTGIEIRPGVRSVRLRAVLHEYLRFKRL